MQPLEHQLNAWLVQLKEQQLLPEDLDISVSLIENLQNDDISCLLCYLVFNLQEEIALERRVPYILSRLGYSFSALSELPNFSDFVQRLATFVSQSTRTSELLPPLMLQQENDTQEAPQGEAAPNGGRSASLPQHGSAPADAFTTPTAPAVIRVDLLNDYQPSEISQDERAAELNNIQQELLEELQSANAQNTRLAARAELLEQLCEYVRLKHGVELLSDGKIHFELLDRLCETLQINDIEVEIDSAKMRSNQYREELQERMNQALDGSSFRVELCGQAQGGVVSTAANTADTPLRDEAGQASATNPAGATCTAEADAEMEGLKRQILQLEEQLEEAKSGRPSRGEADGATPGAALDAVAAEPQERAHDDLHSSYRSSEALREASDSFATQDSQEFLHYLAEKLVKIARQNEIDIQQPETEDEALGALDEIVASLSLKADTECEKSQLLMKSPVLENADKAETKQKNYSVLLYKQLQKANNQEKRILEEKNQAEQQISHQAAAIDGLQRRCRAAELAYANERLTSKRVKTVDKYGIARLKQELAEARQIAVIKGLTK